MPAAGVKHDIGRRSLIAVVTVPAWCANPPQSHGHASFKTRTDALVTREANGWVTILHGDNRHAAQCACVYGPACT